MIARIVLIQENIKIHEGTVSNSQWRLTFHTFCSLKFWNLTYGNVKMWQWYNGLTKLKDANLINVQSPLFGRIQSRRRNLGAAKFFHQRLLPSDDSMKSENEIVFFISNSSLIAVAVRRFSLAPSLTVSTQSISLNLSTTFYPVCSLWSQVDLLNFSMHLSTL